MCDVAAATREARRSADARARRRSAVDDEARRREDARRDRAMSTETRLQAKAETGDFGPATKSAAAHMLPASRSSPHKPRPRDAHRFELLAVRIAEHLDDQSALVDGVAAAQQRSAQRELGKDAAQRPSISKQAVKRLRLSRRLTDCSRKIVGAKDEFRRSIVASDLIRVEAMAAGERPRVAKVGEAKDAGARVDEQVGRLDVHMRDVEGVHVVKRRRQLPAVKFGVEDVEAAAGQREAEARDIAR